MSYQLIRDIESILIAINIEIIYLFIRCKDNKVRHITIYNV